MEKNPWKGLASYREPREGDNYIYKFCGRNAAIKDLVALIEGNLYVTMYGRTGIGKTSLLEAGVFPLLRRQNYIPVVVRFCMMDSSEKQSFAEYVVDCIEQSVDRIESVSNVQSVNDGNAPDFLWEYFATRHFYKGEKEVYPLIVLDQFEENFKNKKIETWNLLEQLHSLINDNKIFPEGYHDETNFRIVISIREDDLFRLEDCIDQRHLLDFKFNRYRLVQPTESEAAEIISIPGNDYLPTCELERKKIIDGIIQTVKKGSENNINTLILSLICSILYDKINAEKRAYITIGDVVNLGDNPLKEFYISMKLSEKTRMFIENNLIDSDGRRNTVNVEEIERKLPKWKNLLEITEAEPENEKRNRILQESNGKVELVHDMLAKAIYNVKQQRIKKEKVKTLEVIVLFIISILFVGTLWKIVDSYSIPKNVVINDNYVTDNSSKKIICDTSGEILEVSHCFGLKHLVVNNSLNELKIKDCPNLLQVEIQGDSIKSIEIENCPNLNYLNIPSFVGKIDDLDCERTYIKKIIPKTGAYIWLDDVLWNIVERKIIYLPKRKKNKETLFPYECRDMEYAYNESDTIFNSSNWIDNILFNKDTTTIISYHSPIDSVLNLNKYGKVKFISKHAFDGNTDIKKLILKDSCYYGMLAFANCCIDTIIINDKNILNNNLTFNNKKKITYIIEGIDGYIKDNGIVRDENGKIVLLSSEFAGKYKIEKDGDTIYLYAHGFKGMLTNNNTHLSYDGTLDDKEVIERFEKEGCVFFASKFAEERVIRSNISSLDCSHFSSKLKEIIVLKNKIKFINLPDSIKRQIVLYVPPAYLETYLSKKSNYGFKSIEEYRNIDVICGVIYDHIFIIQNYFSRHLGQLCLIIILLFIVGVFFYVLCMHETPYMQPKGKRLIMALWKMLKMMLIGLMSYTGCYWFVMYIIYNSIWLANGIAIVFTLLVLTLFYYNIFYLVKDIEWRKNIGMLFLFVRRWIKKYKKICFVLLLFVSVSVIYYIDYNNKQRILQIAHDFYDGGEYNKALQIVIEAIPKRMIKNDSVTESILKYYNFKELEGHNKKYNVKSASFSPDAKHVVTASNDGTAKVWDVLTGELKTTLQHHASVYFAFFSPDGKQIVTTASYDGTAKVWDALTGELKMTLKGSVHFASFSPDGKCIVTSSRGNTVMVRDSSTGEIIDTLRGHKNRVNSACFSPDGKYIVTSSDDDTAKVWDALTGELKVTFKGHTHDINTANFSPDGKYIVTASSDDTAKIWNSETGELIKTLDKHRGNVNSACFSHDGKLLVTASNDEKVMIWDTSTYEVVETLKGYDVFGGAASFSPDGKFVIAASNKKAIVWILDSSLLYEHCKKKVDMNPLTDEEREKYGIKWWMKL